MERKRDADRSLIFSLPTKKQACACFLFMPSRGRFAISLVASLLFENPRFSTFTSLCFVHCSPPQGNMCSPGTPPVRPLAMNYKTKVAEYVRIPLLCFMPSRGIEPRFQTPQACVLSIERRGQGFKNKRQHKLSPRM